MGNGAAQPVGELLVEWARSARHELLLVAPYIKLRALGRVLEVCSPTIPVRVVTRWQLHELASGVSDVEIWPLIANRPASSLWLQPSLHAKYYRIDDRWAVGSANLTGAGLGWSAPVNLEILVDATNIPDLSASFEEELFRGATSVDDAMYKEVLSALSAFPPVPIQATVASLGGSTLSEWRPALRFPEDLFKYYVGDRANLSTAASESAASDLAVLSPPPRMTAHEFVAWVGIQLRQHPEVVAIEAYGATSRRFGEMRGFLAARGALDSERAWQTWMRWLGYFLPDRYDFYVANYSEIFRVKARSSPPARVV